MLLRWHHLGHIMTLSGAEDCPAGRPSRDGPHLKNLIRVTGRAGCDPVPLMQGSINDLHLHVMHNS